MKPHPYAEIFPLIEGAEFESLVADIREHGLREKIWIFEGKILDGRNRYLACQKAHVKPATREFKGSKADALAFVRSANVHRRHLNEAQRAMAASRYKEIASANLHSGDLTEAAAEALNVSRRSVFSADKVREKGSKKLQEAVERGEVAVSKAAAVVDLPKSAQFTAATQKPAPQPDEPERPDDVDEDAALAAAEADYARRIEAVMSADDKVAEANAQLKQQASLIGTLETTRDGYMRGKESVTKMLQVEQRKAAKLEKEVAKLRAENESLRERIAIMEAA